MHLFRRGNTEGPPASASGGPPSAAKPEEAPAAADTGAPSSRGAPGAPRVSEQNKGAAVSAAQANPYFGEDVDDKIEGTGCSKEYGALQDCLDDTDKDWRRCQKELHVFQKCCRSRNVAGA
ncbi:hypothetical protein Emed_002038 [Eimeria media]